MLDLGQYWSGHAQRGRDARRRDAARAREVLGRLAELGRILRARYGVRSFGYFGSLRSGALREDSDVDLFVDEIRGSYWEALDVASTLLGRHVDLIERDRAGESMRACIQADGVDVPG